MKLKYFFDYLSYGVLAMFFSMVQKIFAALSKKICWKRRGKKSTN